MVEENKTKNIYNRESGFLEAFKDVEIPIPEDFIKECFWRGYAYNWTGEDGKQILHGTAWVISEYYKSVREGKLRAALKP